MKYYKQNSIPLKEEFPGINETSFDEYGNFIQIDVFNEAHVLKRSVLVEGEKINDYRNEIFLKGFWAQTKKSLEGYEIQDTD